MIVHFIFACPLHTCGHVFPYEFKRHALRTYCVLSSNYEQVSMAVESSGVKLSGF